ncbi:hypothetical protein AVEN_124057-1 [Araneus ventricosus]|uniref:Uncharacterized protein n=1 Tax=Araneus ventricosus TaxID=182803 RepID=A0A4Y2HQ22_ARAVE|nr:hypothetical protein AVEN_124057-1 [Araneus ventricosus]
MSKEKNVVKNTRQRTMCPIFGPLNELHDRVLPTVSDVLKYYLFVKSEMKTTLPAPREWDRYGISDRAAASVASAVLQDIRIVHEGEISLVVDLNKIRRQRRKLQNAVAEPTKLTVSWSLLTGLYFNGRKDNTKVLIKKDTKYFPKDHEGGALYSCKRT